MLTNPYRLARRFTGLKEVPGAIHNPAIVAMLQLVTPGVVDDETPWCSAFVNAVQFLADLPMSHSLGARSWLLVGVDVPLNDAALGDIVVLSRGRLPQPGPEVTRMAAGHVGYYAGRDGGSVHVLGGNQGNTVSIAAFPINRILSVRRTLPPLPLHPDP
jgi:uncharacterized protein (TIGR02594 family)